MRITDVLYAIAYNFKSRHTGETPVWRIFGDVKSKISYIALGYAKTLRILGFGKAMKSIIKITKATHLKDYVIRIHFSDNKVVDVDFMEFILTSNLPDVMTYKAVKKFKSFMLKNGNLMWGDYEMIFPLADLYNNHIVKAHPTDSSAA